MTPPTRSKEEIRRDLFAILTQGVFVSVFTFPSMYGVYKAWLFFTGAKPDDPISVPALLLFGLSVIAAMLVSGSIGGLFWVLAMRPFLSRIEIEKWLNYGMKSSALERWNARVLDRIYKER